MIEFFTLMCQHPGVFLILAVCSIILIGMTYNFILRLFKRNGFDNPLNEHWEGTIDDAPPLPPEPAKVPNPPTSPDDVLEAEEDLPCTDDEDDYVYRDTNLGISSWTTDFKSEKEVKKAKEGVH